MTTPSTASTANFMLLFRNAGPAAHAHLTAEERAQLTQRWNDWYDSLATQGKVHQGRPLALEGRVVSEKNGRIIDGPYAESKEAIGGYFILNVATLAEATEIAKQCPGLPIGLEVEVRPLADVSPVLSEVRGRPAVS
ncbi:YciI family protein [Oleiharenicola lentus]|uniref:YciI family protein n=1 Tax=Oleiharenicola lentus TaxID=2508720 RepID=UPI003F6754CB